MLNLSPQYIEIIIDHFFKNKTDLSVNCLPCKLKAIN